MSKIKPELSPCPFCGSTDLNVAQWIECNGCGAFGPTPGDDGDQSIWNKRESVPASRSAKDVLESLTEKDYELIALQATVVQQAQMIEHLRGNLQEAIAMDCNDDVIEACAEVERSGIPGNVIREMNDELADLRRDAERFRFIEQDADSGMRRIYGDDWIAVIDAAGFQAMSKEG